MRQAKTQSCVFTVAALNKKLTHTVTFSNMQHEVFISHSSTDKTIADAICHTLEQHGITCWIAPRDVRVGYPYSSEIMHGIKACKVMVLVFTRNANLSRHVLTEIEHAFSTGKVIIPFITDDSEMEEGLNYYLSCSHWLVAYPDYEERFGDLVAAVSNALERHDTAPSATQLGQSEQKRNTFTPNDDYTETPHKTFYRKKPYGNVTNTNASSLANASELRKANDEFNFLYKELCQRYPDIIITVKSEMPTTFEGLTSYYSPDTLQVIVTMANEKFKSARNLYGVKWKRIEQNMHDADRMNDISIMLEDKTEIFYSPIIANANNSIEKRLTIMKDRKAFFYAFVELLKAINKNK